MEVIGTGSLTEDKSSRRGVSFASPSVTRSVGGALDERAALRNAGYELGAAEDIQNAEDKFAQRAERRTLEEGVPSVAAEAPAWLLNSVVDVDQIANTEDTIEEFLQDEDMESLELICAKWRHLDEQELEALAEILPETAKNIVLAEKHIEEFLNYRTQLHERHDRKESVKNKLSQVHKGLGIVAEDSDKDSEDEDRDSFPAPSSMSPLEESRGASPNPAQAPTQTGGLAAARKKSVMPSGGLLLPGQQPQPLPGGGAAGAARRVSVAQSPRPLGGPLARAGASVVGQEEAAIGDSTLKRPNPSMSARRTSVAVPDAAKSLAGRRSSVAVKAPAAIGRQVSGGV